jgi:hypothetical protein
MKLSLIVASALLLVACSPANRTAPGAAPRRNSGRPAIEIRNVLRALNQALEESQGQSPPGFPDLKHVEVQLQARTELDASGDVKFVLVSGGADTSTTHSTSLTLELDAPKGAPPATADLQRARPKSPIARAILAAKRAYIGEQRSVAGPLANFERGDITVEIAFEISDRASAGIDTGGLMPVGLSASAAASTGKTHHIKLVYGNR